MSDAKEVSIYEFTNGTEFLRKVFQHTKDRRPSFSVRAWSLKLEGSATSGALSRVLAGKRSPSKTIIGNLIKELRMNPHEIAYLEVITHLRKRMKPESFHVIVKSLLMTAPPPQDKK